MVGAWWVLVGLALGSEDGIVGRASSGCASCHGAAADSSTTVTIVSSATSVEPGDVVDVTVTVATTSSARVAAGFNLAATGGTLAAGAGQQRVAGELTHTAPAAMTGGTVSFRGTWTAPAAPGTYRLRAAGNAVNANGFASGDGWNVAAAVAIEVVEPCVDADVDGWTDCDGDCDDGRDDVYPGAPDAWYDGVDADCADNDDFDQDGDGTPLAGDCDDTDPAVTDTCDTDPVETGDTEVPVETDETDVPVETDETDVPVETDETDVPVETDETDMPVETDVPVETDETDVPVDTADTGSPGETDPPLETDDTDVPVETDGAGETEDTDASAETDDTAPTVDTESGLPTDTAACAGCSSGPTEGPLGAALLLLALGVRRRR